MSPVHWLHQMNCGMGPGQGLMRGFATLGARGGSRLTHSLKCSLPACLALQRLPCHHSLSDIAWLSRQVFGNSGAGRVQCV